MEKQAAATEEQKQLARQNLAAADRALAQARAATADVVASLLEKSRSDVLRLEYDNARATLLKAAALGQRKTEVAEALYEIAFVDYHTGRAARADSLAGVIAAGLGAEKRQVLGSFANQSEHPLTKLAAAMQARYFGTMIPMEGGSFDLKESDLSKGATTFAYRATVSPFRMAATETIWWQYHLFCRATGYEIPGKPGWVGEGDNPVVNVSWYDAVVYANWRSEKAGFQPAYKIDSTGKRKQSDWIVTLNSLPDGEGRGGVFRLPTEAEWQYAATNRGQDDYAYAGSDSLELVGWYWENSGNRSRPVQCLQANALGLYDMTGNVWEWCWDWYDTYPTEPTSDWRGPETGENRVSRGGGWGSGAENCRAASRYGDGPADRNDYVGFRLCSFSLQ